MYTGITQGLFEVVSLERAEGLQRFSLAFTPRLVESLSCGASVSIDGVCHTVVSVDGFRVSFESMEETMRLTTLGSLMVGQFVSVERSARLGDEIGGHEMAGHVVGTGKIHKVAPRGKSLTLSIECPVEWMKYIFYKGFIGVDGSSLTVGKTDEAGYFEIHLIPETLRLTNFGNKKIGECVNIELDAKTRTIVDTVERTIKHCQSWIPL
ncbi:MAG: riboflavin synthase subunit alpha [Deltaproteobacteria bacterium]|nr:riboflavin synthase subunit alpha [Deltaproteobacteria bacterium]